MGKLLAYLPSGNTNNKAIELIGSPGLLSRGDQFRLVFSGITLGTSCFQYNVSNWFKVTAGVVDGTYDIYAGRLNGSSDAGCNSVFVDNSNSLNTNAYGTSSCTTVFRTSSGISVSMTPANLTYLGLGPGMRIRVNNSTGGGDVVDYFNALVPFCDFADGVIVDNGQTALGVSPFSSAVAAGHGGTCTITRICP